MSSYRFPRQGLAMLACALLVCPLLLGQGCPTVVSSGGAPTVVLHFPNLDRTVAAGEQLTLVYDAQGATSVLAFYDHDGRSNSGDEVVFASNLPTGTNRVAQLATATLPTGLYYLGIRASNDSGTTTVYATGKITVVGAASIVFLSPVQDLNVGPGISVPVRFDAGVTDFSYRIFRDSNDTLDGNETTIVEGLSVGSSLVERAFDTTALPAGTYYVGVTVTTAAGSVKTTYATGRVVLVSGVFIQILAPTVGLQASVGDPIQIVVAANDPANPNATVRVFYDPDRTFGNGNETTIDIIAASAGGVVWNTTGVVAGSYYIGAELQNGAASPSYSAGPVELVESGGVPDGGTGTFTISSPSADVRTFEGTDQLIRWYADPSLANGKVTLLYDSDKDDDKVPDGAPVEIVADLNPSLRAYTFPTTGLTGRFFIIGRLTMDGTTTEATSKAGSSFARRCSGWGQ